MIMRHVLVVGRVPRVPPLFFFFFFFFFYIYTFYTRGRNLAAPPPPLLLFRSTSSPGLNPLRKLALADPRRTAGPNPSLRPLALSLFSFGRLGRRGSSSRPSWSPSNISRCLTSLSRCLPWMLRDPPTIRLGLHATLNTSSARVSGRVKKINSLALSYLANAATELRSTIYRSRVFSPRPPSLLTIFIPVFLPFG
jgi:hypothetical protein